MENPDQNASQTNEEDIPEPTTAGTATLKAFSSCRPFRKSSLRGVDLDFLKLLKEPSDKMRKLLQTLFRRAEDLVNSNFGQLSQDIAEEYDVVVTGCGFCIHFYNGVHSILSQLAQRGRIRLMRFAGSSSGGWNFFKQIITNDEKLSYNIWLAYAQLVEFHGGIWITTSEYQLRWLIEWILNQKWVDDDNLEKVLSRLNNRLFASVTYKACLRNLIVSEYTSRQDIVETYVSTGTLYYTKFKGRRTIDGGISNNLPIFKDKARMQLIVDPNYASLPSPFRHALIPPNMNFAEQAFKKGQDRAIKFLRNPSKKRRDIYQIAVS